MSYISLLSAKLKEIIELSAHLNDGSVKITCFHDRFCCGFWHITQKNLSASGVIAIFKKKTQTVICLLMCSRFLSSYACKMKNRDRIHVETCITITVDKASTFLYSQ